MADTQSQSATWNNFKTAAEGAYSDGTAEKEQNKSGSTFIFTLPEEVGCLADALLLFKKRGVSLTHIESRLSKLERGNHEFYVTVEEADPSADHIISLVEDLKQIAKNVLFHQEEALWFPRKISELDRISNRVLSNAIDLDEDHPGYSDSVYRQRRKLIGEQALKYRHGDALPDVEYTKDEIKLWDTLFSAVTQLHPTHACKEYNYMFPSCNFKLGTIPQISELSQYLKARTGFTIRPVAGLLSARDFLAGLAFRVFYATQYVRHGKTATYTPEPDVLREIIGHVPLLADPGFSQFVQELGLISLGAPEEWIKRISRIYWFTLEFGMIRENGKLKACGACLLTSAGELQYCVSDTPVHSPFEPEKVSQTSYPIQEYQPQYFVFDSYAEGVKKLRQWANVIPKLESVRYNPYTESIETLADTERIMNVIREMKSDMDRVEDALIKIH